MNTIPRPSGAANATIQLNIRHTCKTTRDPSDVSKASMNVNRNEVALT